MAADPDVIGRAFGGARFVALGLAVQKVASIVLNQCLLRVASPELLGVASVPALGAPLGPTMIDEPVAEGCSGRHLKAHWQRLSALKEDGKQLLVAEASNSSDVLAELNDGETQRESRRGNVAVSEGGSTMAEFLE